MDRLRENCYYPMLDVLEGFTVEFIEQLFFKLRVSDLRLMRQKIPQAFIDSVERFKACEMLSDEEGNLTLFDPTIDGAKREPLTRQELRRLLTQRNIEIDHLKEELERFQTDVIYRMRYDYHKELLNLREQLFKKERIEEDDPAGKKPYQALDVRFFDVGDDLPKQWADLLNAKLVEMKGWYESLAERLNSANEQLNRRVEILDRINGM